MDESKSVDLKQFLDISQSMLECAKSNDWDKLPDLENKRKSVINSFFEQSPAEQDSVKIEKTIKDVLSINEKIEQLAQQEKVIIGQQLQGLKKKQNVRSAYLQNK